MSDNFLGEIRIVSFSFAPRGWALCNGQLMPINQNQALFSLFGTTYGGNGQTTFALPDMQGRAGIHPGSGITQGQKGGEAAHTLTLDETPAHTHFAQVQSGNATTGNPTGNLLAGAASFAYRTNDASGATTLHPQSLANAGGSQPHENRQPFTTLNFIVALTGIFPSRN